MSPKHWLESLDAFCVPFTLALSDNQRYLHRSALGGILTVVIATLSVIYASYQIYQWSNWNLLTKVTQYPVDLDFGNEIMITYTLQMYVSSADSEKYYNYPFAEQNNILTPFVISHNDFKRPVVTFPKANKFSEQFLLEFELKNQDQFYIILGRCEQQYLKEGQWCADEEVIDSFFEIVNQVEIWIILEAINPNTFLKYRHERTYAFGIEKNICQQFNFFLQQHSYELDNGYGLNDLETYSLISDVILQSQTNSATYCENYYQRKVVGSIFLMKDNQLTNWKMSYPSIFEILGNIESIISLMLFCKFFIMEFNRMAMRSQILDTLTTQFYPELKNVIINTNFWGTVKSINLNKKKLDTQSFLLFQKRLRKQLSCKLNFTNIIYEITRLQYIVQSLQKREYIKKCHLVGMHMQLHKNVETDYHQVIDEGKLLFTTNIQLEDRRQFFENIDILDYTDINLLSNNIQEEIEQDYVHEEIQGKDFYEANKVVKDLNN